MDSPDGPDKGRGRLGGGITGRNDMRLDDLVRCQKSQESRLLPNMERLRQNRLVKV